MVIHAKASSSGLLHVSGTESLDGKEYLSTGGIVNGRRRRIEINSMIHRLSETADGAVRSAMASPNRATMRHVSICGGG
jgi:hypothetical protein